MLPLLPTEQDVPEAVVRDLWCQKHSHAARDQIRPLLLLGEALGQLTRFSSLASFPVHEMGIIIPAAQGWWEGGCTWHAANAQGIFAISVLS